MTATDYGTQVAGIPQPPHSLEAARPWDLYKPRTRVVFLVLLFLVGTSSYIDKNIIGVLLELIKAELHASDKMMGTLGGFSFALFYAVLGLPVAGWADRGDRTVVIAISMLVWSLMTVLCGFTGSFWQLAAARFGVGAGEAGALPPAQSLIADYFPPAERARSIGIFMLSSALGYALALILGGFLAQAYGWRVAFMTVGVGGFILTPLTRLVLDEPRRIAVLAVRQDHHESTGTAVRILFSKAAYRAILCSVVLYYFTSYAVTVFTVPFIIRVHGLTVSQAGTAAGAIAMIGAIVGGVGGGMFADYLAARNLIWLARVSGWGIIAAIPFYEVAFLSSGIITMLVMMSLAVTLLSMAIPAMFSALHVVCGSRRRAFSVAMTLFFANLLGVGLGPVAVGALSDGFGVAYGASTGLRCALTAMVPLLLVVGWLMLRAVKSLQLDAED